jgi:hypothetical protein
MIWQWLSRRAPRLAILALVVLAAAHAAAPAHAADDDASVAAALQNLISIADATTAALDRGDVAAARASHARFHDAWEAVEDSVRERSRADYRAIEQAMDEVRAGLRASSPDASAVRANLAALRSLVQTFIGRLAVAPAASAAPSAAPRAGRATTAAAATTTVPVNSTSATTTAWLPGPIFPPTPFMAECVLWYGAGACSLPGPSFTPLNPAQVARLSPPQVMACAMWYGPLPCLAPQ